MKISLFDWDSAKSLIQRWFGYFQPTSMAVVYSPISAGTAFLVQHTLPVGVQPNSVWGTVMSGGFIYYYEADKSQWTANDGITAGHVFVRCSVAKAKCEIHISSYDDIPPPGNSLGVSPTSGTGITGLAFGGTGTDLSATGGANQIVKQSTAGGVFTVGTIGVSNLAASTSADLRGVLSDETGTGSAVFATSPTLVTPILGTPTSGTLTNCTGLPVGSGVSGLGTGVATFLTTPSSANLAAAVTDETGTGVLVLATSPTIVTPTIASFTNSTHTHQNSAGGGTLDASAIAAGTLPVVRGGTGTTTSTGSTNVVLSDSPTIVTPTIASFTNATHSHQNSAGGGTLDGAAIAAGKIALARGGTNADLSATGGTSQVLKQASAGAAITVATLAPSELNSALTSVTYSSGNFTANAGTWTVDSADQSTYQYMLIGSKLMLLIVKLDSTTTSGVGTELRVTIPTGATASAVSSTPMSFSTDSFATYTTGLVQSVVSATYVRLLYTNLGNWPNGTNAVHMSFNIWIPLT